MSPTAARSWSVKSITPLAAQTSSRRCSTSLFVCAERRTRALTTSIGTNAARWTEKVRREQDRCKPIEGLTGEIADGAQLPRARRGRDTARLDLVALPLRVRGIEARGRVARAGPAERPAKQYLGVVADRAVSAAQDIAPPELVEDGTVCTQQLENGYLL